MPWVNLLGWMGTGVVLMWILEGLGVGKWTRSRSTSFVAAYYGVVLLMPMGMILAAGLWWAVAATTVSLLLPLALRLVPAGAPVGDWVPAPVGERSRR